MKRPNNVISASLGAAVLAACGAGNNSLSSSTPVSVAPQIAAPLSVGSASQRLERSVTRQRGASPSYKSLYSFTGSPDGAAPIGTTLIEVKGNLYGMSSIGGAHDLGTVFKITTAGKETVIYSFKGNPDGAGPRGGLIDVNGTLYGTTRYGGPSGSGCGGNGCGTVFSVTTTGTEKVLHSFGVYNNDGLLPYAGLINVKGTLYGTTLMGGVSCAASYYGCGTVFEVTTSGTEGVLYSFAGGADGQTPAASLIAVHGELYSTTESGGTSNDGTVFEVNPSTGAESVLHSFQGGADGAFPDTALTDVNGTLYGATGIGGAKGDGTVFSASTSGTEQVVYSFKGSPDGSAPYGNLIVVNGLLYGTTSGGGAHVCKQDYDKGCGTVFSASVSGTEQVLYSFAGRPDGAWPQTNVVDLKGALYGTTVYGGTGKCKTNGRLPGCGTVFELTP
ncbi:MAG TPA: choice-of-anchor tandem repeat GloVer-containing protein [Candidatus Cybelea sp.]|nr:choice-of-anchor tandem repeat GloVer-containing protein [Candidatus Cybelea sp.]